MPTTLNQLLIDSCTDVELLERLRRDPQGELAAAGVDRRLRPMVLNGRGSVLSRAAVLERPLPSEAEIVARIRERAEGDPVFVTQLQADPTTVISRMLGLALQGATVEVTVEAGELDVRVLGLPARPTFDPAAYGDEAPITEVDTESDVETESETESETEVETEMDVEVNLAQRVSDSFDEYWGPRRNAWRAEHEAAGIAS